jgi:hypothetical protein
MAAMIGPGIAREVPVHLSESTCLNPAGMSALIDEASIEL